MRHVDLANRRGITGDAVECGKIRAKPRGNAAWIFPAGSRMTLKRGDARRVLSRKGLEERGKGIISASFSFAWDGNTHWNTGRPCNEPRGFGKRFGLQMVFRRKSKKGILFALRHALHRRKTMSKS